MASYRAYNTNSWGCRNLNHKKFVREVLLMALKLETSKNVVGCRVKDTIFVHPELQKEPRLFSAVIKHEVKHSPDYKMSDFFMDLGNEDLKGVKKEYWRFILKHPRTLLGLLPFGKVGKYWTFDLNLLFFYLVSAAVLGITLMVGAI